MTLRLKSDKNIEKMKSELTPLINLYAKILTENLANKSSDT